MSKKLKKDRKTIAASRGSRMSGSYKQFSQEAFDRHDRAAVQAVIEYLDSEGVWAAPNDDTFGPDIVVWHGFRPAYYIEVAQRSHWKEGPWPRAWTPIRIEGRKLHLFNSLQLPCEYWIVRRNFNGFLVLTEGVIRSAFESSDIRTVSNAAVRDGERFLHVPLEEAIEIEIKLPDAPEQATDLDSSPED